MTTQPDPAHPRPEPVGPAPLGLDFFDLPDTCQECDAPAPELFWKNPTDRSASPVMICEVCWYLNGTPVRELMTASGAGDAPVALLAHLADAYRIAAREVGPRYALADIEVTTQRAADAWRLFRAEHGPRALWSRERGFHVATVATIIEDVTR